MPIARTPPPWVRCCLIVASVIATTAAAFVPTAAAAAAEWAIDCAKEVGVVKPLHGVNAGPTDAGGTIDLSASWRSVGFPLARLHDCNWPNPDAVDMHVVFPNADADPSKPESYDFVRTDAYVRATLATGSGIVYRLGESIEHGPDKRRQRPPADPARWAAACLGVIRHYNHGWAGGFEHGIRYWEIWNEPDNRPNCWTGTDEEYIRLYVTTAKAIKAEFPNLKVGGPAIGHVGSVEGGAFRPTPFVRAFLDRCRSESAPLDFFSWHWYGDDRSKLATRARGVRAMLDESGFGKAESHLNEWNYLPGNDWGPMLVGGQGLPRRQFYERIGGADGAAFAAATLLEMQDLPVDVANYFTANTQGFGLFDPSGVPKKSFHAFRAFAALAGTPLRLAVTPPEKRSAAVCAGMSNGRDRITVLIAKPGTGRESIEIETRNLPWDAAAYEELRVDGGRDLTGVRAGRVGRDDAGVRLEFDGPGVCLLKLRKAAD